jgi:hypothetical protein
MNIQPRPGPEKARACLTHVLQDPPRRRAVRNLLEIAELRAEQRDLLVAALSKARKRGDGALVNLLEAAMLANLDLAAEVDLASQALGQIDVLWASGEGGRP